MRYLITLILALIPFSAYAGTGGGAVGPRPTLFSVKNDWVRTVQTEPESLTFLYKSFGDRTPTIQTVPVRDLNDVYLEALSNSFQNNQWIPIPIGDQN